MKIALNAHLLSAQAGYRSAGIHSYIENLLRCLPDAAPADWSFSAFVGAQYSAAPEGILMRRSRINTERPLWRIAWEQLAQPPQLAGFDLSHALAFVAPLLLPTPTVVTVYDLSFIHYPERLPAARRRYLQLLTRLTCQRARRIIAISHSTARDLTETLGIAPDRIDIAEPGYDSDRFYPLPAEQVADFKRREQLPDRYWLFVGTLEPRKNLVTLIDAYAMLPASERPLLVLAGGKGWDSAPIFEAVARHGLEDTVRLPGFLAAEDLPLWYNGAEAFLYPSIFEGFGLPVLEAMACGTPVIVSDTSSLPEVVGDAGACVPPADAAAWRDALRRAATDAQWSAEARERGLERARRFSWAHTARETVASYRRALSSGS